LCGVHIFIRSATIAQVGALDIVPFCAAQLAGGGSLSLAPSATVAAAGSG
jgi:hypothetical protein